MAYIYDQLKNYLNDYQKFSSHRTQFDNLIKELKKKDNPEAFLDRFSSSSIFKKKSGDYRLIIEKRIIENTSVYCIKRLFNRDDKDYEKVYKPNPEQWLSNNPISQEDYNQIRQWFVNLKEEERLASQLPKMPEELIEWFNNENFEILNSIYEMYEWTASINHEDFTNKKETIIKSIFDIYENKISKEKITKYKHKKIRETIQLADCSNNIYILFERYGDLLVLYKIFKNKPSDDEIAKVAEEYLYSDKEIDKDLLKKDAKRAYPAYILADTDLWCNIQEDSVGNLALSPEQEVLLRNSKLPLFINGQAGSGKSTMLFYLFAHMFFIHRENNYKPLFLTYNNKLLETAKNSVKSILKNHPNFSETKINEKQIESLFFPFQLYIINHIILHEEGREKFTKENYISFNKFRKLYTDNSIEKCCRLQNKKKFSPELVWHVIRTYIKGSKLEEFTEEDFDKLQKKDKSVSKEIFEEINNTIWKSWYSKFFTEYGLWDDQDIIKFTLKNISLFPENSVVFCDESQDFTKNEIELILKFTAFTKFDLTDYPNIPICFAGDPYQTINPTGFRWESLKEIFSEKFNKLTKRNNIQITFEPLSQNYRSKAAIIKFANFIQGIRLKYLDITELEPQQAYQKMHGLDPCLFVLGKNILDEKLKSVAINTIFIVPSDADIVSEKEFAKKDDVLRKIIDIEDDIDKPIANVLSSSSAKGLEFDKIIVYKFGANRPLSFDKALSGGALSDSEFIELSHFFNKLYVAISRAKDYLFIVDDKLGRENFWKHFENTNLLNDIFYKREKWNKEDVNILIQGTDKDVEFMEESDPIKVAKSFEESGMANNDPNVLMRASKYYNIAGNRDKTKSCKAYAYLYSEKFHEAGELFEDMKMEKEAFTAYWKGKCWKEISVLYSEGNNIWKTIADYMQDLNKLDIIFSSSEDFIEKLDRLDGSFGTVLDKIKSDITKSTIKSNDKADFARKIAEKGSKEFFDIAADYYFSEKLYEQAIKCWDKNNNSKQPNYYKAKLEASNEINDSIKWMYQLNMYKEIIGCINNQELNNQSHHYMFNAMLAKDNFVKALNYENIPLKQRIERLSRNTKGEIEYQSSILNYLFRDEKKYTENLEFIQQNIMLFYESIISKGFHYEIVSSENCELIGKDFVDVLQKITEGNAISDMVKLICEQIDYNFDASKVNFALHIISKDRNTLNENNLRLLKSFSKIDNNINKVYFGEAENEKEIRKRLTKLINSYIWENKDWASFKILTVKEMALALFNCNTELKDIIDILEYIIQYEIPYAKWAKEQWLLYKERQWKYELSQKNEEQKKYEKELNLIKREEKNGNTEKVKKHGLIAKRLNSNAKKRESNAEEIKKKIIQRCEEWKIEIPNDLKVDTPLNNDENPYVYDTVQIFGLSNREPEIDSIRKRVSYLLEYYELKINLKTQIIHVEDINTNEIVTLNVAFKEFKGKMALQKKYNILFDKDNNQVGILLEKRKITIIFELLKSENN
jgi:hypothetical protein